jgi:hypothetical protein
MLAVLHSLGMFIVDVFKPRRRLEAENLFLRHQLSIALRYHEDLSITVEFENESGQIKVYESRKDDERTPFPVDCNRGDGVVECQREAETNHWATDALNGISAHVFFVPSTDFSGHKLISYLLEHPSIGEIAVSHQGKKFDAQNYIRVLSENFTIFAKIYGKRSTEQNCSPLIRFPLTVSISTNDENNSTFKLLMGNLHYDSCEIVPL